MKPLTNEEVLTLAQNQQPVFFRWYHPEIEGQLSSAWKIRKQGLTQIELFTRKKVTRRNGKYLFLLNQVEGFSHDSQWPLEEGHEIDGNGFIFLFNNAQEADIWEAMRRQRTVNELASLRQSIQDNLTSPS
jgi:hypothetical protein